MTGPALEAVLDGLLYCLGFLELSGDDVVDPDAAVAVMESVGARLSELPGPDRATLVALVLNRLETEKRPEWREFIESVPDGFGLLDDDTK